MIVALRASGCSFVAVAIAVVAAGWAAAAGADMVHDRACARLERRIEAGSRRRLDKCAQTAANREARGGAFDLGACEARERARNAARRAACGCPTGAIDASRFRHAGVPGRGPVVVHGEVRERAYEIVDGEAILEGDIILGPAETDGLVIALPGAEGEDRPARSATGPDFRWTRNTIPYELDPALDATMRDRIFTARDHWNANTIVRLRPRSTERDFVRFTTAAENCWSSVGRVGGGQQIRLAPDCLRGSIIHEIGHAVGLRHEHTRHDRDRYVIVRPENAEEGAAPYFDRYPTGFGIDRGRFDFGSIMMYGSFFFSNGNGPTITKLDGSTFTAQTSGALSKGDIAGVTMMITRAGAAFKKLRNSASGLCLSAKGYGAVSQVSCSTADSWYWYRNPVTVQSQIINASTGLCLEAPGASSGSALIAGTCRNTDRQQFGKLMYRARNRTLIRNLGTNLCVEVPGGSTTSGTMIRQYPCGSAGMISQGWTDLRPGPNAAAR